MSKVAIIALLVDTVFPSIKQPNTNISNATARKHVLEIAKSDSPYAAVINAILTLPGAKIAGCALYDHCGHYYVRFEVKGNCDVIRIDIPDVEYKDPNAEAIAEAKRKYEANEKARQQMKARLECLTHMQICKAFEIDPAVYALKGLTAAQKRAIKEQFS